jgi:hypothetical protein
VERAEAEAIYEQGQDVVVAVLLRMDEQIQRLTAQVARQEERILKQEERIAQLERRLSRSSRNSSAPPSPFAAGFSERFAQDVLAKATNTPTTTAS